MKLLIAENYESLSKAAAHIVAQVVTAKPTAVLGLATGSTPIGMYRELARLHREEGVDFSRVTTFNLDEYVGLPPHHPQSYHTFMQEHFFRHVNIPLEQTNIPRGDAPDLQAECRRYEAAIAAAGGIDLQVLGIGGNGHIGFNEPGSDAETTTRIVELAQSTIKANARFFESIDEVPTKAVSMGIKTILAAKRIMLLASGEAKADAVRRMLEGEKTPDVPASLLQLHSDVTVIADKEAAALLSAETKNSGRLV
ncbi:glucosamine-6-phosphate deaminase [Brevibacillus sp. MCWH]|jgi:glucosamine-6-phosphate deaminase|uniref:glucosamine-6-phosphate deaminase n=1 Tax=Brevibacillus sp. MCWH TaxID=2508871 RepID=UPI0014912099|nr:glucosamine-6-phosphate deaminase [Brevibacillus sp. MCWH]NNV03029.1 glucosamine-6-phosphate deaminase [Brevibacillus sp. MCWH]